MDTKTTISKLSAAYAATDAKTRLALCLCTLLIVIVALHRSVTQPTPTSAGDAAGISTTQENALIEPVDGEKNTDSIVTTAKENSVQQPPRLPLTNLKTGALQQQSIHQSPLGAWASEQPLIQPNRKLGLSRPKWLDSEWLSLQQRYGGKSEEKIYTVMIDPGHGGSDPGSVGHNGLLEKEITLDIARRAALFLLEVPNVRVQLTRQSDRGMSRATRVSEIKNSNADMVISLHLNHLPQTDLTVVETFYAGPENIRESQFKQLEQAARDNLVKTSTVHSHDLQFTKQSRALAQIMQERVYDEVRMSNATADSAGVKQDTLFVLTRSFTPGALIELTAISNVDEANRLATEGYRNRLAAALADGIRDYVELASTADSI